MAQIAIVGGGVVGTMHALEAIRRGHDVTQLERDAEPRKASVRNFGLIWVSGRAPGRELELALRARERWAEIARDVPGIGFRPDGSLTIVNRREELDVIEELCADENATARGVRVLTRAEVRARNTAVHGDVLGAMVCEKDAIVEPRSVLPAVRDLLASSGRYTFRPSRNVLEVSQGFVRDHTGERYNADLVIVCAGADLTTLAASHFATAPLKRCRLQMLETSPLMERIHTALADGDSLRYYPAFRTPAADRLPRADPLVERFGMQLLVAQRDTGALTIGDTHAYDEPFDFWVEAAPYEHLIDRVESILNLKLPPIARWWAGVYTARTDDDDVWYHGDVEPGVIAVTGLGGRGMTLSPAVAEVTLDRVGL